MMPLIYILFAGAAFFSLGLSGIFSSRHFIIAVLSIELMFLGGIITAAGFYNSAPSTGDFFIFVLGVWGVMSVETIALVTLYVYMSKKGMGFDLKELNKYRG